MDEPSRSKSNRGVLSLIETERLTLRRWTLEDAVEAASIYGDPETMRLFGSGKIFTPSEIAESLAGVIAGYGDGECGNHAVIEKRTGQIIGHCGVHRSDEPDIALEADWLIRRERWNRGLATEAATAVFNRIFQEDRTASIYGVARADNFASIAVMRKLGMRYLRDGERNGFKSVIYAVTAD